MLFSVTCVRDFMILVISGVVRVAPLCGERFDFPRLSQDSVGEIQLNLIILIGEILGAYALTASLDRVPRFACGLDRPKPR